MLSTFKPFFKEIYIVQSKGFVFFSQLTLKIIVKGVKRIGFEHKIRISIRLFKINTKVK